MISGILPVNKSRGKTSFWLVKILRKTLEVKKIGHAGTLDPFATGVMIMLIGREYTRLSNKFLNREKEYLAQVCLGIETDSYDCDGQIIAKNDKIPTLEEIEKVIKNFQGEFWQIPPMFSAKKINGQKLYNLARQGKEIERPPKLCRATTTILSYEYPYINLRITCSKGTYIRSIAHDIGKELSCGAHLSQLERTRSGDFSINECISGEHLNDKNKIIEFLKT